MIESVLPRTTSDEERALVEQIQTHFAAFTQVMDRAVMSRIIGNYTQAVNLVTQSAAESLAALRDAVSRLLNAKATEVEGVELQVKAEIGSARLVTFVGALVAVVIAAALSMILPPRISRPAIAVAQGAQRLAAGDLTVDEIEIMTSDEIGQMGRSFNEMVHKLRELIQQVSGASQRLAQSNEEMTMTASEATRVTKQIAETIEQVRGGHRRPDPGDSTDCHGGRGAQKVDLPDRQGFSSTSGCRPGDVGDHAATLAGDRRGRRQRRDDERRCGRNC